MQTRSPHATSSVIALDIGGTKIAGAIVTYAEDATRPTVHDVQEVPTDAKRGGDTVLATLVYLIKSLIAHTDARPQGIGVGTAGCVDPVTGSISYANELMPGWTGQPVKQRLSDEFSLPVAVMGDVHAHALGEARWGAARNRESCLLVAAGTGLGGAFVDRGHVLRGFHGAAGHLGHTLHPAAQKIICACGSTGHAESVTSGTGIAALYQNRTACATHHELAFCGAEISRRAEAGEEAARLTIRDAGRFLGEAMGSWANAFDPEVIIVSGSVCAAGPLWREAVVEGFASQALEPVKNIPLLDAALGFDAPLVGAAENLRDALQSI
ncbi:MAG: ROK family protein [Raoultibacter sp.]